MLALILLLVIFAGYIICYRTYGRYLARKIFNISQEAVTPAVAYKDDMDYVPTRKEIIFGHHFTSIAGTGPIVGPAIAIIWGWLPALLWIFIGSVVMGAVHDFGSLIISMRNQGKSISEVTARYINNRTRILFFIIVFLTLWIVLSVFGLVIAIIFSMFPSSVLSVWLQLPIAVILGYIIYKKEGNILLWSLIAVVLLYGTMLLGTWWPIILPDFDLMPATGSWTIILFIYAFVASVLPVTALLQPRDFINAFQLIIAMLILTFGIVLASLNGSLHVVAPVAQISPPEAPPLWPFLFITIACGAISGFHSLVASGTSAKQVRNEKDALFVGYGSMLLEGTLAVLVIIAVAAGIGMGYMDSSGTLMTGADAWNTHYASWSAADGLGSKISAFVVGAANMIDTTGIPHHLAIVIMGVFVASFAGTTLDTATRIQRYVISELASDLKINSLTNKYAATTLAVLSAALLAFASGADGRGALLLWPLFGAVNQTLAALALIIVTLYLKQKGGNIWLIAGLPSLFMSVMTFWSSCLNQVEFGTQSNYLLQIINFVIVVIVVWIIVEGTRKFFKNKQGNS